MKMKKWMVMAGVGVMAAGIVGAAEAADTASNPAQMSPVLLAFRPGFSPRNRSRRAPGPPPPMRRERRPMAPGPQFVWTSGS